MKKYLITSAVACSMLFSSCGKETDTGVNKAKLSPTEAAENWKKDTTEGRVASLWDSLPVSYQGDVEGIVHNFGSNVDSEVYDEAMKTVSLANNLLKSKKSILLELVKENEKDETKYASIEANYDSVVGLLNAVLQSDIKTASGLSSLNIAKFCGDIQPHTKNLAELAALADEDMAVSNIKNAVITLISEEGDNAEIEMTMEGKPAEKVKLTKFEDRWVPADMSSEWDAKIAEAQTEIAKIEEMKPEDKKKALNVMKAVQDAIKMLDGANSKDELQLKTQQAMGSVFAVMMAK